MGTESIRVGGTVAAAPAAVYRAWLNSRAHSAFTGGKATVEARVGGRHSAWDGYIRGTNLLLEDGRRIVQTWRSADFPKGSPDSRLKVTFAPARGGTTITIVHTEIPEGQGALYAKGWRDHYLAPMKKHFAKNKAKAKAKRPAKTAR